MLLWIILALLILIILAVIITEYRNEKQYQAQRRAKKTQATPSAPSPKPTPEPKPIPVKAPTPPQENKALPEANYPPFSHSRLLEMGLSESEAHEFVQELIPQLEDQIPLIQEALQKEDFHQMERLTHSIKGSATNLGTGGISDLLVACNTYLKTGTDPDIAQVYFEHLIHYTKELKVQYS